MDKLKWIHLSDIHYQINNYNTKWLRDKLIDVLKENNEGVNILVITGDLQYQFKSKFKDIEEYLQEIIDALNVDLSNVFIVIGNHDFCRSDERKELLKSIKSSKAKIKDRVAKLDKAEIKQLIDGQSTFWKFHNKFLNKKDNYGEVHFINEMSDYNIINLNTCLISGTSKEEGTLSINMNKLIDVLRSVKNSDKINIAIGHHSLECFVKREQEEIVHAFEDYNIDIYLCGHIHKSKYKIYQEGQRRIPSIVCGSNMFDDYAEPSFVIGEIDLKTYEGKCTYYKWSNNNQWIIDNEFSRKIKDNYISFEIDRFKKKQNNIDKKLSNQSDEISIANNDNYRVPRIYDLFTGRDKELKKIDKAFNKHKIAILFGLPGIGKTQIAKTYTHENMEKYTRVFWIRASNLEELDKEYLMILKYYKLGKNNINKEIIKEKVKKLFSDSKKCLVVFDNVNEIEINMFKEYIPQTKDIDIIITSQNSNWDSNEFQTIPVVEMSKDDAKKFILDNTLDRKSNENDQSDVETLITRLNRYPLTLDYARAFINARKLSIKKYIEYFDKYREKLFKGQTSEYNENVLTAWRISFDEIINNSDKAVDILKQCSFMNNVAIPINIFGDMIEISFDLDILQKYSMITYDEDSMLFHSITQEMMRQYLRNKNEYSDNLKKTVELIKKNFVFSKEPTVMELSEKILPHVHSIISYLLEENADKELMLEYANNFTKVAYDFSEYNLVINIINKVVEYTKDGRNGEYIELIITLALANHYTGNKKEALECLKEAEKITNSDFELQYRKKMNYYAKYMDIGELYIKIPGD